MWAKCRECGAVSSIRAEAAVFTCRKCGKRAEAMQVARRLKAVQEEIVKRQAKNN